MIKFSLLHPSRNRPEKSYETLLMWINRAGVEVELIVSIDEDDQDKNHYYRLYNGHKIICNANRSAIDAVNKAAEIATGEVLIVVSDDFECPRNWALTLDRILRGRQDYLLKVHDGTQNYIVTLPILDKVYYERFGYVYNPEFRHMFCDTLLTHTADVLKKLYVRNDIVFRHNHYSVMHTSKDEVSKRADSTWHDGKKLYLDMVRQNLGLPTEIDIFDLRPEGHNHKLWLKQNL